MTPAALLASAVGYGIADFSGGFATRSVSASRVAAASQTWGLLLLVPAAVAGRGSLAPRDALLGLVAGLAGALGLVAYFRALAIGPMGVVSPVAAVIGTLVPVVAGLGIGERPPAAATAGIGAAALSVLLASGSGPLRLGTAERTGIILSVLAGTGFGAFFVLMHAASGRAGLWPLIAARAASLALLWALATRRRPARGGSSTEGTAAGGPAAGGLPFPTRAIVAASGLFDMAANILYVVAVHHGLLSITAVTVSLYPIVVVVLARLLLRERLTTRHRAAAVVAVAAAVLISI